MEIFLFNGITMFLSFESTKVSETALLLLLNATLAFFASVLINF